MKARELIKILEQNGFQFINQKGSHAKYSNPITKRWTIVPIHSGDIPPGTLNSIKK